MSTKKVSIHFVPINLIWAHPDQVGRAGLWTAREIIEAALREVGEAGTIVRVNDPVLLSKKEVLSFLPDQNVGHSCPDGSRRLELANLALTWLIEHKKVPEGYIPKVPAIIESWGWDSSQAQAEVLRGNMGRKDVTPFHFFFNLWKLYTKLVAEKRRRRAKNPEALAKTVLLRMLSGLETEETPETPDIDTKDLSPSSLRNYLRIGEAVTSDDLLANALGRSACILEDDIAIPVREDGYLSVSGALRYLSGNYDLDYEYKIDSKTGSIAHGWWKTVKIEKEKTPLQIKIDELKQKEREEQEQQARREEERVKEEARKEEAKKHEEALTAAKVLAAEKESARATLEKQHKEQADVIKDLQKTVKLLSGGSEKKGGGVKDEAVIVANRKVGISLAAEVLTETEFIDMIAPTDGIKTDLQAVRLAAAFHGYRFFMREGTHPGAQKAFDNACNSVSDWQKKKK